MKKRKKIGNENAMKEKEPYCCYAMICLQTNVLFGAQFVIILRQSINQSIDFLSLSFFFAKFLPFSSFVKLSIDFFFSLSFSLFEIRIFALRNKQNTKNQTTKTKNKITKQNYANNCKQ